MRTIPATLVRESDKKHRRGLRPAAVPQVDPRGMRLALYDDPVIRDRESEFFGSAPVGQIFSASVTALVPARLLEQAGEDDNGPDPQGSKTIMSKSLSNVFIILIALLKN